MANNNIISITEYSTLKRNENGFYDVIDSVYFVHYENRETGIYINDNTPINIIEYMVNAKTQIDYYLPDVPGYLDRRETLYKNN